MKNLWMGLIAGIVTILFAAAVVVVGVVVFRGLRDATGMIRVGMGEPGIRPHGHEGCSPRSALMNEWCENVRTNMAIETCASFFRDNLRPFLIGQMDPDGTATADERDVIERSILFVWHENGYYYFPEKQRLVDILDRTAKKPFAGMVKAFATTEGIMDGVYDWLVKENFSGEDMRCIYWTLRYNDGIIHNAEMNARLENAPIDEWIKLLWRIQCERNAAWAARGSGVASTVTDEGWGGFDEHGKACRAAFRRAWELHRFPEAGNPLSTLGPISDEVWTELTLTQLDFCLLYDDYLFYNCYPRWCGSIRKMKDFAQLCYDTKRHDTMVPVLYAEFLLRALFEDGVEATDYFKDHGEELDRILEVCLPQVENVTAFKHIRMMAGACAAYAYSLKGEWAKAAEVFRKTPSGEWRDDLRCGIRDLTNWEMIWKGISGRNGTELQRLHALYAAGDYDGYLDGLNALEAARVDLESDESRYVESMKLCAAAKAGPSAKPIVAVFSSKRTSWQTPYDWWQMTDSFAFCDKRFAPLGVLIWEVAVSGNFRAELEIAPREGTDDWRFDFCLDPNNRELTRQQGFYCPFLIFKFSKDNAVALFGHWENVESGVPPVVKQFKYEGGKLRIVVEYRDGKCSVFVGGSDQPLIETDRFSRELRRVKEGRFEFGGTMVRLRSLKVVNL